MARTAASAFCGSPVVRTQILQRARRRLGGESVDHRFGLTEEPVGSVGHHAGHGERRKVVAAECHVRAERVGIRAPVLAGDALADEHVAGAAEFGGRAG